VKTEATAQNSKRCSWYNLVAEANEQLRYRFDYLCSKPQTGNCTICSYRGASKKMVEGSSIFY